MQVRSLGLEDPLEKKMATRSSIFAWKIHGQRSLAGYSSWGHKELDTAEQMSTLGFRKIGLSSKKKYSRCLKGKKLPNHRVYCQCVYGRKIVVFLHDFNIYKGQEISSDIDIRKVRYRDIFVRQAVTHRKYSRFHILRTRSVYSDHVLCVCVCVCLCVCVCILSLGFFMVKSHSHTDLTS